VLLLLPLLLLLLPLLLLPWLLQLPATLSQKAPCHQQITCATSLDAWASVTKKLWRCLERTRWGVQGPTAQDGVSVQCICSCMYRCRCMYR
jgi:hypothetical protein